MSYPLSTYVAQIAVAEDGNPQISVRVRNSATLHPTFPRIAVPAKDFPTALSAEGYAEALIRTAGILTDAQPSLVWVSSGHTLVAGRRYAARTAALADPVPTPAV
jgi:hypothetical protein